MYLHNLQKTKRRKRSQRIGRGGKRGTYSGRGQKGQKSRAGRKLRPAQRDLILRIPKRRGFTNKPKSPHVRAINLADLKDCKGIVDRAALQAAGLIGRRGGEDVKILGTGDAPTGLVVRGLKVSKSVKEKIEKAGGRVE